ncbi:MAG TPA: hypothetical protein VMI31_12040, partial [Fimbriimonadaceae bacterium]|nr:hypothetical protein [Fimbriimonadaceae bacterium]
LPVPAKYTLSDFVQRPTGHLPTFKFASGDTFTIETSPEGAPIASCTCLIDLQTTDAPWWQRSIDAVKVRLGIQ